ncbi:3396_t:CDS:2, partial [Gigaspora margarita]
AIENVKLCEKGDGYSYVYYKKHYNKQTKSTTFTYWCNCRQELEKKARKFLDNSKQPSVKLDHVYLHPRPQHIGVTDEINKYIKENLVYSAPELYKQIVLEKINGYKLFTVDQAYYWWAHHAVTKYQRANNQLQSAKLLLNEKNYKIILEMDDPVEVFAFITPFITELPKITFETLLIDATYNTTKLKHELYSILAVIDGTGFPISYLYISSGKNRDRRMILSKWFKAISNMNINNVKILLSDKDFSQISSAQAIWKDLRVQLCKWHVKRAIEQKLSSTKKGNNICYDANKAHNECPVIDPRWNNQHMDTVLCNKVFLKNELRKNVIDFIETHFHRHMLIPTADKEFVHHLKKYGHDRFVKCSTTVDKKIYYICGHTCGMSGTVGIGNMTASFFRKIQRNSYCPLIEETETTMWEKIRISPDNAQLPIMINSTVLDNNDNNIVEDDESSEEESELEIVEQYRKTLYE